MLLKVVLGVTGLFLLIGCGQKSTGHSQLSVHRPTSMALANTLQIPAYKICETGDNTSWPEKEGFLHTTSRLFSYFRPHHQVTDVIAVTGNEARFEAKLTYGDLRKDLKDEWVELWVDNCDGKLEMIHRLKTNDEGRISVSLKWTALPAVGAYRYFVRVVGDNSFAAGKLRVVPPGTRAIVFDIDGTLTISDKESERGVISEFLGLEGQIRARKAAVELTRYRRDTQGYIIIYLTGRPHFLTQITRSWLDTQRFAPGSLYLAKGIVGSRVGTFKRDYLAQLKKKGIIIDAAYGNRTTDVFAYKEVGMTPNQIFTMGEQTLEEVTHLGDNYLDHLQQVKKEQPTKQPFFWLLRSLS